jgi:formamidopyrimidine-DNA glycosylase
MPELPEVELLCRRLEERFGGRVLTRLDLASVSALKTFDPPLGSLVGRTFGVCRRRGKYICMRFDDSPGARDPGDAGGSGDAGIWLVVNLGRAGWIKWRAKLPEGPVRMGRGPLVLRAAFSRRDAVEGTAGADGNGFDVTEMGHERRLAVWVTRSPDDIEGVATLGPEPLDPALTETRFAQILAGEKGDLKHALSRQSVIAGVGNAYSDEVLHAARLSPFKSAAKLSPEEIHRLYGSLLGVLQEAIARAEGLDMDELKDGKRSGMAVHARTGQPCPVCGDTVREVAFATRSLQYCPTCQTGGRPLADRRLSRLLK